MLTTAAIRRPPRARAALAGAATILLGLVLAVLPTADAAHAQTLPDACGDDPVPADYTDRDQISAVHLDAVDCATQLGIAAGLGADVGEVYLPDAAVRRDQMASFVAQTLQQAGVELPDTVDPDVVDVAPDATHAEAIAQLSAAGIVSGVDEDHYDPSGMVRRDQMASFLLRALAYQADVEVQDLQAPDTPFTDVPADGTHSANIRGLYHLGVTAGTSQDTYSPQATVTREAMASFLMRSSVAMETRRTVADRDGGALPHTVFTFPSESGRCFQVTAGNAWETRCEPTTDDTLQVRTVPIGDSFSVLTGVVTDAVSNVRVEYDDGASLPLELVATGSSGLRAWASPILADDVDAIVADDGEQEIARTVPDDPASPPFDADTDPEEGSGMGDPVVLTDVDLGRHATYDRVVLEVADGGHAGWRAAYVDEAIEQGSGQTIDIQGEAILRVSLTNTNYPTASGVDVLEPDTRFAGVGGLTEVYVGTTFEGSTQLFVGLPAETPFRVFALEDPDRIVVDVLRTTTS